MRRRIPLLAGLLAAVVAGCGDDPVAVPVTVRVVVEPASVDLAPGASVRFTASVTVIPDDGTLPKTVRWELSEDEGYGTITADGVYTAPLEDPPRLGLEVQARSDARPLVVGTAAITLTGAGTLVDAAWIAFEAGDYSLARSRFLAALADVEEDSAAAGLGLAWTDLRLGSHADARAGFRSLIEGDAGNGDALCGLVLASAALDLAGDVRDAGVALIALDPDYAFSHDASVSVGDVRWFTARAALDLGDFDLVADQLDVLVPGHGLDPASAGFAEEALALLESIQGSV